MFDKKTYEKYQQFWKNILIEVCGKELVFIENKYGNGQPVMDGNPIVHTIYKNKCVRVILVPETMLDLYIDEFIYDDVEYPELVIFINHQETDIEKVKQYIKDWFNEGHKIYFGNIY